MHEEDRNESASSWRGSGEAIEAWTGQCSLALAEKGKRSAPEFKRVACSTLHYDHFLDKIVLKFLMWQVLEI